jgi:hypothetical protein
LVGQEVLSALIGTVTGVALAVVSSLVIPLFLKRQEKVEQKRGIYEKYAQPLAADAVNLLWRLDEILFKRRGQYLLEDAPPTPFNQYKLISTCYRIAAILGWIRAIRLEQSYLFYGDQPAVDALRGAVIDFESALADSPRVEARVLNELARLWRLKLPADADRVARAMAQVVADMQHFLSSYALTRYHELGALDDARGLEVVRQVAASVTGMLSHPPVSDQELVATCRSALTIVGVKQAWIYRDWQQAIGDLMIREIEGAVRRFDIIGYGAFETLYRETDNPWVVRLRDVVIGIDVARPEPADLRLEQLRHVARATASLVCAIETLDLERRVLDPKACDLARKFLAELPAMADAPA